MVSGKFYLLLLLFQDIYCFSKGHANILMVFRFIFYFRDCFGTIYHDHIIRHHFHFIRFLTEEMKNIPYLLMQWR